MKKKTLRILAVLLCFAMLAGCEFTLTKQTPTPAPEPTDTTAPSPEPEETPAPRDEALRVAVDVVSGRFSPFTAETAGDLSVVEMTQLPLLTVARGGEAVLQGIEGETIAYEGTDYTYTGPANIEIQPNYDGTTTLRIRLRDDLRFSDGTPVTADDLLFTYYVLLDPDYVGANSLRDSAIAGLRDYSTGTPAALYDRYAALFDSVYNDGDYADSDYAAEVENAIREAWIDSIRGIVDYCAVNYMNYAEAYTGYTSEEIREHEGLRVMFGMYMWNFANFDEAGNLVGAVSGTTWDLSESFPTIEDFYSECLTAYAGDPVSYWNIELGEGTDVVTSAKNRLISEWAAKDPYYTGQVTTVSGLVRTDDYSVELTVSEFSASDIFKYCDVYIAPMHFYGDPDLYDYEAGSFGFPAGEVGTVTGLNDAMGAGPYCVTEYAGGQVSFTANEYYWKGVPKTTTIRFMETEEEEKLDTVLNGELDLALVEGSPEAFAAVREGNSNGELAGEVVAAWPQDFAGYGYIGINADSVNVGGDPDSEASKNLRRALMTIMSACREKVLTETWGEAAYMINAPICASSWAAPEETAEAFSIAIDGTTILEEGQTAEQRLEAAVTAAKAYFRAAGYVWDEVRWYFTDAPTGAKLKYKVLIQGGGEGDHPCYAILEETAGILAGMGLGLEIVDLDDSRELLSRVAAGTQEIWVAAWEYSADPDLYWNYSGDCIPFRGGEGSNYYAINDAALNAKLVEARKETDRTRRAALYEECMKLAAGWACELPTYQRLDLLCVGAERVDASTIVKDPSPWWSWMQEIHNIALLPEE
ncbi:MAG: ABC transporter substrate-binding protein [Eubacteriales bacterium]|nr:ABC transporter substrate-binding protein [Eubacteriales bacterium]